MKKVFTIAVALLCTATLLLGAEDWRGNNRISGIVVEKGTGKPVPNAKISLRIQKGAKGGPDVKSGPDGKWAVALCLAAERSVATGTVVALRVFLEGTPG